VDSGCDKELVFGDPTAPRFVFWENKLRKTPSGPDAVTFDLLSIVGKIRAGLGAIGIKPPMPGGLPAAGRPPYPLRN
jgi:protoporphyrinogen/coproporphyrinogen III oxidase